jgi:hypothetical protein
MVYSIYNPMALLIRPLLVFCIAATLTVAAIRTTFAAESAVQFIMFHLDNDSAPEFLGPIDEVGRLGWTCRPEIRARAVARLQSALPEPR